MFTYVNEWAVIGTAIFMVAVAMIWYSEHLFQKPWLRSVGLTTAKIDDASPHMMRNFLLTLSSYLVAVFLIANAIGFGQVAGMSVQYIALGLTAGFAALLAGFVVWEQRSLTYYLITVGFVSVFIIGSSFLLYYWPW
ncbi:DUF1761 domain-containing protein [Candidatus Pacebacteria bacterium]|nr:DUF1761 domain-containing protein [Candidatus Paceibacterota bacterium]